MQWFDPGSLFNQAVIQPQRQQQYAPSQPQPDPKQTSQIAALQRNGNRQSLIANNDQMNTTFGASQTTRKTLLGAA